MPPKKRLGKGTKTAVSIPRTIPELEQVLRAFLGGGGLIPPEQIDQQIRQATTVMKAFIREPASVPALFQRISIKDMPADSRQLACVLLSKNIARFWPGLQKTHMLGQPGKSDAQVCREHIMTILHGGDAPPAVIHSLSYLTSIIARLDLLKGRWPQLLEWLSGALQSPIVSHVDAALRILYSILNSSSGAALGPHFTTYYQAFQHWITNAPSNTIRNRALMALHSLLGTIQSDQEQEDCITMTLSWLLVPLKSAADAHDYESLKSIITIYSYSIGSEGFDKINIQFVQAMCPIILNTEIDLLVRDSVGVFFTEYISTAPLRMTTPHTTPEGTTITFLTALFHIIFGLIVEEDDDPFSLDEASPQKIAVRILEDLYRYLPREEVFPVVVQKFIEFVQSPLPTHRKAAYVLCMVSAQSSPIATFSSSIVTLGGKTGTLLQIGIEACCATLPIEQDPIVQQAACIALTYFGEELQGIMDKENLFEKPFQTILAMLPQVQGKFRQHLFMVLDTMCETAGMKMVPLLPQIMQQLAVQLNLPELEQQEASISTISSIAFSVEHHFRPYFAQLLPMFNQILTTVGATDQLRVFQEKTLVALASCARGVGLEAWTPEIKAFLMTYVQAAFHTIFEGDLKEHQSITSYIIYLGNVAIPLAEASQLDDELIALLSRIFDACIRVVRSLDGVHLQNRNLDAPTLQGFDEDSDNEEGKIKIIETEDPDDQEIDADDIMLEDQDYYFETQSLETKAAAIQSLSLLMTALGPKLFTLKLEPLVDDVEQWENTVLELEQAQEENRAFEIKDLEEHEKAQIPTDPLLRLHHVLLEATGYLSDVFLIQCFNTLTESLTNVVAKMTPIPKDIGVRHPLPQELVRVTLPVVARLIEAVIEAEDPKVVAGALNCIIDLLQTFGCSIIYDKQLESLYDGIYALISETATCSVDPETKDERSDHGEAALESVCELIGRLARVLGPVLRIEFVDAMEGNNMKALTDLCAPKRPDTFRAIAIGCLAEIVEHMGPATSYPLAIQLLPVVQQLLTDPSHDVRHNGLYFAGECASALMGRSEAQAIPQQQIGEIFQLIIKHIQPPHVYPTLSHEHGVTHDNAVSAALKFVLTFPAVIPYSTIPQIMSSFPLREDQEEMVKLILLMPQFFTIATDIMRPLTGAVLAEIAIVLQRQYHSHRPQDEPTIINFAKSLITQFPQDAQQAGTFLNGSLADCIPALQRLAQ